MLKEIKLLSPVCCMIKNLAATFILINSSKVNEFSTYKPVCCKLEELSSFTLVLMFWIKILNSVAIIVGISSVVFAIFLVVEDRDWLWAVIHLVLGILIAYESFKNFSKKPPNL